MNFWYPVAASAEVTNEKPVRARLLTLDFVAFRDAVATRPAVDYVKRRRLTLGTPSPRFG